MVSVSLAIYGQFSEQTIRVLEGVGLRVLTSNIFSKKPAPKILMKSHRKLLEGSKNKNILSEIGAFEISAQYHKLDMANFQYNR